VADAARDAREVAYADGRIALGIRAGDAENRALSTLIERLGVKHEAVIETAAEVQDVMEVFRSLHPSVARALADAFRDANRSDIATALDDQADRIEAERALEATS
jgi:hypothetical protein